MNPASQAGPGHVQTSLFTITTHQNNTFSYPHFETETPRWRSNPPEKESTVVTEGWPGSGKAGVEAGWSAGLAEQHRAQPRGRARCGMERALGNSSTVTDQRSCFSVSVIPHVTVTVNKWSNGNWAMQLRFLAWHKKCEDILKPEVNKISY